MESPLERQYSWTKDELVLYFVDP
uniref:Uncharacterized protein n=1 Tax=Lepeophtheirus salmonis TaxID=72036 RepID=A0A0K2TNQ4_LEPSM